MVGAVLTMLAVAREILGELFHHCVERLQTLSGKQAEERTDQYRKDALLLVKPSLLEPGVAKRIVGALRFVHGGREDLVPDPMIQMNNHLWALRRQPVKGRRKVPHGCPVESIQAGAGCGGRGNCSREAAQVALLGDLVLLDLGHARRAHTHGLLASADLDGGERHRQDVAVDALDQGQGVDDVDGRARNAQSVDGELERVPVDYDSEGSERLTCETISTGQRLRT